MSSNRKVWTATIALAVTSGVAQSQTATQTVTFQVSAINQINISANPAPLIIAAAPPGGAPTSVTNAAATYAITTNEGNKNIIAALNLAMPPNVSLSVTLAPPATGTSTGTQALSATPTNVVTSIDAVNASGLGITYRLSATAAAGTVPSTSRIVTFTIVTGP